MSTTSLSTGAARRFIEDRLLERNEASRAFFAREAPGLARACREMAGRFTNGGRLLAFGRGASATDAQHVAVEFVHPVIVGKRALPALDLSFAVARAPRVLARPEDIVMGFAPPEGDAAVTLALEAASAGGALTFALPGEGSTYSVAAPSSDRFLTQELIEVLYHTLWESVHVFFEHREHGHDVGASAFLYPFLGSERQDTGAIVGDVEASIRAKAEEDERLRSAVAGREVDAIAGAARAIAHAARRGGSLLIFGNGGSATDANDWAIDAIDPPPGLAAIAAVSLSSEPATLTALANDVGREVVFARQLLAHARRGDVAVGISTSGGSPSVIAALQEAGRIGLTRIALLGHRGSAIERDGLAEIVIVVDCDYIPRIQEVQASIYHAIVEAVGEDLRGERT
jgi:D-sedoheptulose 7-phosphate isomerase